MTKQTINYGADGTGSGGDTARTALQKLEANFNEIFSNAGSAANAKALNELAGVAGTFGVFTAAGAIRLASIIGAVTQSGGVPTGAIIERGSNANGEYVRYADGTQECWKRLTLSMVSTADLSALWTWPAAFISTPTVNETPTATWSPSVRSWNVYTRVQEESAASCRVVASNPSANNVTGDTLVVNVSAKGRWF